MEKCGRGGGSSTPVLFFWFTWLHRHWLFHTKDPSPVFPHITSLSLVFPLISRDASSKTTSTPGWKSNKKPTVGPNGYAMTTPNVSSTSTSMRSTRASYWSTTRSSTIQDSALWPKWCWIPCGTSSGNVSTRTKWWNSATLMPSIVSWIPTPWMSVTCPSSMTTSGKSTINTKRKTSPCTPISISSWPVLPPLGRVP